VLPFIGGQIDIGASYTEVLSIHGRNGWQTDWAEFLVFRSVVDKEFLLCWGYIGGQGYIGCQK
jgi:hypothetical protein